VKRLTKCPIERSSDTDSFSLLIVLTDTVVDFQGPILLQVISLNLIITSVLIQQLLTIFALA
jgi:hypothetical protein